MQRVLYGLHQLPLVKPALAQDICFKTDFFTHMRLYSHTRPALQSHLCLYNSRQGWCLFVAAPDMLAADIQCCSDFPPPGIKPLPAQATTRPAARAGTAAAGIMQGSSRSVPTNMQLL